MGKNIVWYKVLDNKDSLVENRVMTVHAGKKEICLVHFKDKYCALDNHCPHQGGPLGEGSIENELLRCPWHGWDYHPCTGIAPGFDDGVDTYDIKIKNNAIFVGLPKSEPDVKTISDVMVETMVNWGVDTVFGMVGHSNLGLADAIRKQSQKNTLSYIGIRHEGAAAFAASAYGKLTGRPAACLSIAGPGATNMYTGMWDAKVDRSPLLALTGQIATQVFGTGNFQELDLVRAFQSVATFNHRVQADSQHAELMVQALRHAILNREPAHLTFPDEIQGLKADPSEALNTEGRINKMNILPPSGPFNQAVKMINDSKKPVIIIGNGCKGATDQILLLAEKLTCPILTTFKGKGLISDSHPLACGVLGRSGTPIASYFMNESDLIIAVGASFSHHTGITPKKPIIQIDFDPLALSKFHKIDCALWGEISVTIEQFLENISERSSNDSVLELINKRWSIWRKEKEQRLKEDFGKGLSSILVFDTLSKLAPNNAVMCVDVGNNAYSFGRYFECTNHTFLMSGYLGSIGFALPASLGAWAAVKSDRPVIVVAGDGGICQYLSELTTIVKYNMPIKVIVMNNNELGKISKEQRSIELDVWETDLINPDFADFATSTGALGLKVSQPDNIKHSMQKLFQHDGPGLLEILTDVNLV